MNNQIALTSNKLDKTIHKTLDKIDNLFEKVEGINNLAQLQPEAVIIWQKDIKEIKAAQSVLEELEKNLNKLYKQFKDPLKQVNDRLEAITTKARTLMLEYDRFGNKKRDKSFRFAEGGEKEVIITEPLASQSFTEFRDALDFLRNQALQNDFTEINVTFIKKSITTTKKPNSYAIYTSDYIPAWFKPDYSNLDQDLTSAEMDALMASETNSAA